jgi:SAM-dependent methyltransferase
MPLQSRSRLTTLSKRVLPKPAKRFVLLNILGLRRKYTRILQNPSRVFLEREVLPWLAQRHESVLFVGTAPYTFQFEKLFRRSRIQYTTIDPNAGAAVWGARQHIVAPLQEIGRFRPAGFFDCVVLNGVFGFGIDDIASQRNAVRAVQEVLAPGGLLLVGWNTNLQPDLEAMGLFEPIFIPAGEDKLPWPHRTRFASPETHVYDFYTRCALVGGTSQ